MDSRRCKPWVVGVSALLLATLTDELAVNSQRSILAVLLVDRFATRSTMSMVRLTMFADVLVLHSGLDVEARLSVVRFLVG